MRRPRRRYRRKFASPPGKNIFFITLILFIIAVTWSVWFIDKKVEPVLYDIASVKLDEFGTRAINQAVRFAEEYDYNEVLDINYDNEGNVVRYGWNPAVVGEINRVATDRVEEFFQRVNRGDPITYDYSLHEPYEYGDGAEDRVEQDPTLIEVPLGQVTGNAVLANLGPKIPINLEFVGNVRTNIVRDVEPFGINASWVSLYVNVEADVQVVIPFTTEVETINTEIYIDGGAIMGDVPEFYGGEDSGPSISVPKEDFLKEEEDLQEDE
ncbi:sporulation protein YunB [Oceanobacillus bengalensis]|uniref:Sporulation protein YunB n=1 Tax=Oceanobacillus bengalensis TaxID=1435466 RepID=A0A494YRH5_9BACI|nr:sporulation protein YunB [Oceanobacillus bengalensis]RKQ11970.1 sporulation protein YunB [Oceanobacillus bengalensis]